MSVTDLARQGDYRAPALAAFTSVTAGDIALFRRKKTSVFVEKIFSRSAASVIVPSIRSRCTFGLMGTGPPFKIFLRTPRSSAESFRVSQVLTLSYAIPRGR